MKKFETKVSGLNDGALKKRYLLGDTYRYNALQTDTFSALIDASHQTVLDVGCGQGYFSFVGAVDHHFKQCYGCDIFNDYQTKELLQMTHVAKYRPIHHQTLPFKDNYFDLVFSMDVIEHVPDDIRFIQEKMRVCKRGGDIIIGTPNYLRLANRLLLLIGQLKFPRGDKTARKGSCHMREYKIGELVDLVKEASQNKLHRDAIDIIPCWLGILPLNFGLNEIPDFLVNSCHYFLVKFKKSW